MNIQQKRERPEPGEIYKHWNGGYYKILPCDVNSIKVGNVDWTLDPLVKYKSLFNGKVYIQPEDRFLEILCNGKPVNPNTPDKYDGRTMYYRFSRVVERPTDKDVREGGHDPAVHAPYYPPRG